MDRWGANGSRGTIWAIADASHCKALMPMDRQASNIINNPEVDIDKSDESKKQIRRVLKFGW